MPPPFDGVGVEPGSRTRARRAGKGARELPRSMARYQRTRRDAGESVCHTVPRAHGRPSPGRLAVIGESAPWASRPGYGPWRGRSRRPVIARRARHPARPGAPRHRRRALTHEMRHFAFGPTPASNVLQNFFFFFFFVTNFFSATGSTHPTPKFQIDAFHGSIAPKPYFYPITH